MAVEGAAGDFRLITILKMMSYEMVLVFVKECRVFFLRFFAFFYGAINIVGYLRAFPPS